MYQKTEQNRRKLYSLLVKNYKEDKDFIEEYNKYFKLLVVNNRTFLFQDIYDTMVNIRKSRLCDLDINNLKSKNMDFKYLYSMLQAGGYIVHSDHYKIIIKIIQGQK